MAITHSQTQSSTSVTRCDGCLTDVSKALWIHCTACRIDICPMCVCERVQIKEHSAAHTYRVSKTLASEKEVSDWAVEQELMFLDALIVYGIGNWDDIAAHIGGKSGEDVRIHYTSVFGIEDNRELEGEGVVGKQSNPLSQEIGGYMPQREDFDTEYKNDAEVPIKEMVMQQTDTQLDREVKEAMLSAYRDTLAKRQQYRELALKKGLLQAKKLNALEKTLCSAGKEILRKLKPLLKIMTKEEFCTLFQGLYIEALIKKKISTMDATKTESTQKKTESTKKQGGIAEETAEQMLSEREKVLCNSMGIACTAYIAIKEAAVLGSAAGESSKRAVHRVQQGMTEHKVSTVLEFLAKNKWIQPEYTEIE